MKLDSYKSIVILSLFVVSPVLFSIAISYLAYGQINYDRMPWIYASCLLSHIVLLFKRPNKL